MYTVALISVDRTIYLKKPLIYGDIITPWRMLFAIVMLWVFFIAISLTPLFGFGKVGYSPELATCVLSIFKNFSFNANVFAYFILIILLMAFAHLIQLFGCGCMIYITRKYLMKKLRRAVRGGHSQRSNVMSIQENRTTAPARSNYNKSQLQLVKVFGAVYT